MPKKPNKVKKKSKAQKDKKPKRELTEAEIDKKFEDELEEERQARAKDKTLIQTGSQSKSETESVAKEEAKRVSKKETKKEAKSASKAAPKKEELHPLETVTNILLIRHGHTAATEQGLLYSDGKMPMTEKGIAQSKLAAKWATRFEPDIILTGKAHRVAKSAEALAKLTGLKPQVIQGFEEWQVGEWEGRSYLDIKKKDPREYQKWCEDPVHNAPPGGESIDDLVQRIGRQLNLLLNSDEYAGKKIAMVTHSGIIRSIIVHALDMPVSNFWRLAVPTGSISRVNFSKNFATVQFSGLVPEE